MRDDLKISICGDVCSECPRYLATQSENIEELGRIADLWYRLGFRDKILNAQDLKCSGCNKDKICPYGLTTCDRLPHKDNCGECEYFPCARIDLVFQNTDKAEEICKTRCTDSEYQILYKAFFRKKQILTDINELYRKELL